MGYDKTTPRSVRIDGRIGKGVEALAERGRRFYCTAEGCKIRQEIRDGLGGIIRVVEVDRELAPDEVVGSVLQDFFHKGHLGHKVVVGTGDWVGGES